MLGDKFFQEQQALVDLKGKLDVAEEQSKRGKHRSFCEVMSDLRKHIILGIKEPESGTSRFSSP